MRRTRLVLPLLSVSGLQLQIAVSMPPKYSGEDALAYQEGPADPAGPVNYVQKRLQKRKGIEVVFDPKGQK